MKSAHEPRPWVAIILGIIAFGGIAYFSRGCATPREQVTDRTAQLDQPLEEEQVMKFDAARYLSRCREVLGNDVSDEKCATYVGYTLAAGEIP